MKIIQILLLSSILIVAISTTTLAMQPEVALLRAVQLGSLRYVNEALEQHADVNKLVEGTRPLYIAVLNHHITIIIKLYQAHANADLPSSHRGETPRQLAQRLLAETKFLHADDINHLLYPYEEPQAKNNAPTIVETRKYVARLLGHWPVIH